MSEQIDLIPVVESDDNDAALVECDHCATEVSPDDTHSVRINWRTEETWCDSCTSDDAVTCDSCDESAARDYTTRVRVSSRRVATWCDRCADGETVTNSDTGDVASCDYANEHWHFWESDEEWHSDADDDSDLHDYGTDVISELSWPLVTPRNSLCFGVELEFETTVRRGEVIEALGGRDGNGRYILKTDGSLDSERGIELVTLPYTLDYHASTAGFDWQDVLRPLQRRARSGSGTTACGMHVHVNRRALTPLQIGKALVFLNCAANSRFVTVVAQRASNGFCDRDTSKKISDAKHRAFSRYDMLNISSSATIEFRLFRGNLRPERVLKNLEFCHALLTYCATASLRDIESIAPFCDWLAKRSRTYQHLTRFLRESGYLPERKPVPAMFAAAAVIDA